MNEALVKARLAKIRVTSVKEVQMPKPAATYELTIANLA
jgi:hypothetical protein